MNPLVVGGCREWYAVSAVVFLSTTGSVGGEKADGLDVIRLKFGAFVLAVVGERYIQAALGEEKRVVGVYELAAAAVPGVGFNGVMAAGATVADVEVVGFGFAGVINFLDKSFDQGGFARAAFSRQQNLDVIVGLLRLIQISKAGTHCLVSRFDDFDGEAMIGCLLTRFHL